MTPAATAPFQALSATPTRAASAAGHRVLRAVVAVAALSALGGCAMWNAMFGDAPAAQPAAAPAPVASAPQSPVSAPATPEPMPSSVVSAPVSNPTPPTATELTPPSPLPVVSAPAAAAPASASKPRPAAAVVPSAAGFYLNIGLFAVPTNGSNAVHKLEAAGQPVFFEVIDAKKGPLTRVRVGPFAKRAEADAAAKKIHALQLEAVVFERK